MGQHLAVVQDEDGIRDPHHEVHEVLHQQDRDAAAAERQDQLPERVGLGEVQPRRRLVQEQQRGLGGQAAGDLEQPLLTEGQAAGRVLRAFGKADQLQAGKGPLADLGLLAAGARRPEGGGQQARPALAVAADHRVLEHGHVGEDLEVLEGPGDPEPRPLPRGETAEPLLLEPDLPSVQREDARDEVEDGGLPRPVGADDRADLARGDVEGHVGHGHHAAECFGEPPRGQQRRRHQPPAWRRRQKEARRPDTSPSGMKIMMATRMMP